MIDEKLSAFLDAESNAVDIQESIRLLKEDCDYRATWQRQLWAREALYNDAPMPAFDGDFSERVLAALDADQVKPEKVVQLFGKRRVARWWQGAAGLAAAASVAAAAVLVVQPFETSIDAGPAQPAPMIATATGANTANSARHQPPVVAVSNRPRRPAMSADHWSVSSPAVAEQLNSYLLEHSGLSTRYGMSGARPSFVRVATYGWNRGR